MSDCKSKCAQLCSSLLHKFQGNPNRATVSHLFGWPHFDEVLTLSNEAKRKFYVRQAVAANWGVGEQKRQKDSCSHLRLVRDTDSEKELVEPIISDIKCCMVKQLLIEKYQLCLPNEVEFREQVELIFVELEFDDEAS